MCIFDPGFAQKIKNHFNLQEYVICGQCYTSDVFSVSQTDSLRIEAHKNLISDAWMTVRNRIVIFECMYDQKSQLFTTPNALSVLYCLSQLIKGVFDGQWYIFTDFCCCLGLNYLRFPGALCTAVHIYCASSPRDMCCCQVVSSEYRGLQPRHTFGLLSFSRGIFWGVFFLEWTIIRRTWCGMPCSLGYAGM